MALSCFDKELLSYSDSNNNNNNCPTNSLFLRFLFTVNINNAYCSLGSESRVQYLLYSAYINTLANLTAFDIIISFIPFIHLLKQCNVFCI